MFTYSMPVAFGVNPDVEKTQGKENCGSNLLGAKSL